MKKKLGIIIGILAVLIVGCVIAFFVMRSAAEDKVVGMWQRETTYLEKYGCDCDMYVVFSENHEYLKVLKKHDSDEILSYGTGKWSIKGFEVTGKVDGEPGQTPYKYNPITNTLKNGKLKYKKVIE